MSCLSSNNRRMICRGACNGDNLSPGVALCSPRQRQRARTRIVTAICRQSRNANMWSFVGMSLLLFYSQMSYYCVYSVVYTTQVLKCFGLGSL